MSLSRWRDPTLDDLATLSEAEVTRRGFDDRNVTAGFFFVGLGRPGRTLTVSIYDEFEGTRRAKERDRKIIRMTYRIKKAKPN